MRACHFQSIFRTLVRDKNGSIAIMSAAAMAACLGAAALAVDAGSLYTERRKLQGVADLAAIAAASDLANADRAVAATLHANDVDASFQVILGQYRPDAALEPADRFIPGQHPLNAARVQVTKPGNLFFGQFFVSEPIVIGVEATAANTSMAAFSIGSRLLAVRDGIMNELLRQLLGTQVSLSVMDYEALVKADIEILAFVEALGSQVNVRGGTYRDVLDARASVGNVLAALLAINEQNGNTQAALALRTLLRHQASLTRIVPLNRLIALGELGSLRIGDPAPGLDAKVSAIQLLSGAAVLANGSNQVRLNLTAAVPGVLGLTVDIAIGEPPQHSALVTVGQNGSFVRTAQTRLRILADVAGIGAVAGLRVRLPIYLDLAYGEGRLHEVACAEGKGATATVAARPGIADLWIGEVNGRTFSDFRTRANVSRANIISSNLLRVSGQAHLEAANVSESLLRFDQHDVDEKNIRRTDTNDILHSIVTSLLNDLRLDVQVLGLGLGLPSAISSAVSQTLAPVAKPIDAILHAILTALGVHVGEVDVQVHGIACSNGALAG